MRNPIYILSKGRPECLTAKALLGIGYPGQTTIVCGDDDDTIPDYVDNFGSDRVIVFHKDYWWDRCDMMDAYGKSEASGISPVRNFIIELARKEGYDRCWQFDDDMVGFDLRTRDGNRVHIEDGQDLYDAMDMIEEFGRSAGIASVGFSTGPQPTDAIMKVEHEVCTAHNVTTSRPMMFRARIFEDAVCMFDMLRHGEIQYRFNFLQAVMNHPWYGSSMSDRAYSDGGMKEQYDKLAEDGGRKKEKQGIVWIRNVGYATMALPRGNVLVERWDSMGHKYRSKLYRPMVMRTKYEKV